MSRNKKRKFCQLHLSLFARLIDSLVAPAFCDEHEPFSTQNTG